MILNEGEIIMEAAQMTAKEKMYELARMMEALMEEVGKPIDAETREMMTLAYLKGKVDGLKEARENMVRINQGEEVA